MAAAAVGHHFAIPLLISNFPPPTLASASYSSSSPVIFTTNSNFHYSRLLSSISPILSFSADTRQRHFRRGNDCYCFGHPSHIISATPSHHPHLTLESTSFEQEEEKEEEEEKVVEEEPEAPFLALSTTSLPFRPTLTVKEKKELASYAHTLGKKLKVQQVGKSGVTPSVAASFVENLECNELLKIKIHGNCPGELIDVVRQLEESTWSIVVGQIGRSVILYRPSIRKMKKRESQNSGGKIWKPKPKKATIHSGVWRGRQVPRESSSGNNWRGKRD